MPRLERFGLGNLIEESFLKLLDTLRKATYANINNKISLLEIATDKVDALRFFTQMTWETRIISNNNFAGLGEKIEEIGRMIGGWRKGLLAKTSASNAEEKQG